MAELYDDDEFIEEDMGMDAEEIQAAITLAIEDAVDFIDNTISPQRAVAAEYYAGEPLGNEEEGRSTAQTMDVRDTVQAMLPSLMRIFCGSDHVVEYAPTGPEDVEMAKQATDYVNYILNQDQDQSYIEIIYATMKDALVKGSGFIKYCYDESEKTQSYELENLDDEALAALNSNPDVEIDMLKSMTSSDNPEAMHSVRVTHRKKIGKIKVESVPPEEIVINRNARSLEDADLVAHRAYLTISDMVELGYDADEIEQYATTSDTDFELFNVEARERYQQSSFENSEMVRRVLYVEAYAKIDTDGDGVAELRRICCAGPNYEILRNEPTDMVPFAFFCPDPEPHAMFGMSIADLTMDIQRIKTAVLRASLDSLAMSTHPRVGIVEGQASLEDVMNNEAGGVIRMRQPGAVVPFNLPFVGKEAFPMLDYLDQMRENRTGVSKAADGLDPSALQSSTLMAVQQTIGAAQQRTEMIARLFADGGMTRLYKGLLQLIIKHMDKPRMIRLRNTFVPMSPDRWNADMDVVSNVALGKGGDVERMQMLQQVADKQEQLLQQLGPENPLVSVENYYQTLVQILEVSGFKDPQRFFKDPSQQPPTPPEPPKPDINEQLIQVQMAEIQANIQKKQAELELEREKMIREDDRRRDESEANLVLKAAEMNARYGAQVDVASIRANADRDRELVRQLAAQQQVPNAPVA
jgi:hypothetical protein